MQGQEGDSLFVVVEGTVEVFVRRERRRRRRASARAQRHRGRRDVAADRRAAQRDRAGDRRRRSSTRSAGGSYEPILAGRPELVDALTRRDGPRGCGRRTRSLERYDADARAGLITRRLRRLERRARARRRPGGVRAEGVDVAPRAVGQLLRLRERDAVLRGREDGRGEAAKVRSAAVKRSPQRYRRPSGRRCGDRVERRGHAPAVVAGVPDRELAPGPARGERVQARERLRLPGAERPGCCRPASAPGAGACARRSGAARRGRGPRRARDRAPRPPGRR